MRGSRCAAQPPHWTRAGTAMCGSHRDERAPAGRSCSGECGASSLHDLKTGTLRKSQATGEAGAGWGGNAERFPLQSGRGSGNGASPAPRPQPGLEGSSGHRCDPGSSPCPGPHHPQAGSGRVRPHRRNAATCYG